MTEQPYRSIVRAACPDGAAPGEAPSRRRAFAAWGIATLVIAASCLITIVGLCLVPVRAADATNNSGRTGTQLATATNTYIYCTNGAIMRPTNTVFRGGVRVFDPQLYLECEHLTVHYPSNSASGPLRTGGPPGMGNVSTVVALTNVLMMMQGSTIIGDRAIYTATNDLVEVTGEVVIIETESVYAYGTHFTFDRRTMDLQSIGPSKVESRSAVSLIQNTNTLPNLPGGARPRRSPATPSNPTPRQP